MIKYLLCVLFSMFLFQKVSCQLTEGEEELLEPALGFSEDLNYSLEMNLWGLGSSQENLPFWMYHNQRGRVSETSEFSGWLAGKAIMFFTEDTFLIVGASLLYQNGTNEGFIPDELYAHLQSSWLYFTVGRKQRRDLYNGLSASNENILWSLNARPLPGLQFGTSRPIFLFKDWGPGFAMSWNEYFLGKNRGIENARLHHKSVYFLFRTTQDLQVRAGVKHFAHWGGTRRDGRELSEASRDYLEAIRVQNNLHTHITSYEVYISQGFRDFRFELHYNHFATDRTGRRYGNSPDGRYGIFYEQYKKEHLINSVMYEFYYTKHQSHDSSSKSVDNYFNFYQYSEGWAYKHHFLGAPFFTYNRDSRKIINNKFTAHHIGIEGQLSTPIYTNPYKILLSYARNHGTYGDPFTPKENAFYTYLDLGVLKNPVDVNVQLATEFNSNGSSVFGMALHFTYKL